MTTTRTLPIPAPPVRRTATVFDPFDRTPREARREMASIGRDDSDLMERQDRNFYRNLQRQSRYGF